MKEINLPPFAPVLMESTRAIGYSLDSAIADLLDNSITANCSQINIQFWPNDKPYLSVLDNGNGMNLQELTNAMRYGSKHPHETRKDNDLGRFGLGLKTASLSQCRNLTVISLKDGVLTGCSWDLDVINLRGEWVLLVLDTEEINELPMIEQLRMQGQGTIVLWRSLDRLSLGERSIEQAFSEKMNHVREHISLVFHRYIQGEPGVKKVKILINEIPVEPTDPFLSSKSNQIMDDETILIEGQRMVVRPYILPHTSKLNALEIKGLGGEEGLRRQQGFYVYRNYRLLIWGTWFRLLRQDELYKLARIRVDLPNTLDHLWALDIKKSAAVPPEIVRKSLSRIVAAFAEGSKRTWTFRGKREVDEKVTHVWNRMRTREGVRYDLNREYPLLKVLENTLDTKGRRILYQFLQMIESNLPINSLYVDLNNDEKIVLEEKLLEKEYKELAMVLLNASGEDEVERQNIIDMLSVTEPFCQYPKMIQSLI